VHAHQQNKKPSLRWDAAKQLVSASVIEARYLEAVKRKVAKGFLGV